MMLKEEIDVVEVPEMTVIDTHAKEALNPDDAVFRKADANYNFILRLLGSPGRYQIILLILLGIGTLPAIFSDFATIFYSLPPKESFCLVPEHHYQRVIVPECAYQMNRTLPIGEVTYVKVRIEPEGCRIVPDRLPGDNGNQTDKERCVGWRCDYQVEHQFTYDREWTVLAQWRLSCDGLWLFTGSVLLYFVGAFSGTLLFDLLCKRFGYKFHFFSRFLMVIVLSVTFGFERALWLFALLRFMMGLTVHSIRYSCMRLIFDLLPANQRLGSIATLALSSGFGLMIFSIISYGIRDWRFILMIASTVCLLGLSYQWLVPESLRWLMSRNQTLSAQQVFYKILANNRQFVPLGAESTVSNAVQSMVTARQAKHTWRSLLRSPATAKPFLAIIGLCFMSNTINYGVLLSIPQLGGGVYVNVFISGLLDVFAICGTLLAVRKINLGRILFVTVFMSGLLILAAGLIPGGFDLQSTMEVTRTALLLLGRVGMGTTSFMVIEMLFRALPLGAQSSTLSLCSCTAMISAIFGTFFAHIGHSSKELEFPLLGLLCVCASFLTFGLLYDPPSDSTVGAEDIPPSDEFTIDEEQLVFESLPDLAERSPYVI